MRRGFLPVLLVLLAGTGFAKSAHELWKAQFNGEGGILSFDRNLPGLWPQQQGIVFLSPERLLVYQVNRNIEPAPLAQRNVSGGSGNYHLLARVFDARSGKEIKRMQFATSAEYSSIIPTYDGKFLVRAGNALGLYSPEFELLTSRKLIPGKEATLDYWQVRVTPSGKYAVLMHQKRFLDEESVKKQSRPKEDKSEADLEIINADTFESLKKLHFTSFFPIWFPDDHFLLSTPPGTGISDTRYGILDFDGHWSELQPPSTPSIKQCIYNYQLLPHDLKVAYGCGDLVVFSESGEKLLSLPHDIRVRRGAIAGAGDYLALENKEYVLSPVKPPRVEPVNVQVYDLKSQTQVISAKVDTLAVFYAVSPKGLLAIIDTDTLKIYEPKKE